MDGMTWEDLAGCAWTTISVSPEAVERAEADDLARKDLDEPWKDRVPSLFRMLQARTMNGQISAAYEATIAAGTNPLVEADAARFAMMFHLSGFPDTTIAGWAASVMERVATHDDLFWLGARALAEGRVQEAKQLSESLAAMSHDRAAGSTTWRDTLYAGYTRADADALSAYIGLSRGEWDRLAEFEDAMLRMAPWGFHSESPAYYLRYQVGKLLFEEGRLREAERYFRSFYQYQWMYLVPSHYYLGRIYEELDRPDDAAYHYGLFVEWWRDADPELQSWWEEGRTALARVTGEPRGVPE